MFAWLAAGALAQGVAPHALDEVACTHCHTTPHEDVDRTCASCHTTDLWTPTTFTVLDHGALTFPLEGRHIDVECSSCHIEAKLVGLPQVCSECHVDRHRGKLGADCTECHSVDGFKPVLDFDHAVRTGFALTGHHERIDCASCHQGDNGRALRLTMTPGCETCHTSSHAPFDLPCAECHTDQQPAFTDARKDFDHRDTSFALERRHRPLGCAECHPVGQTRTPQPECRTCHDDVHAGQLSRTCSDCHRPDRWTVVRFDHDMAGWPLRGRHFVTPCESCHTNQRWIGMRTECWDCHAVEALQGPASVTAHTRAGADCADCHNQWTWR